MKRRLSLHAGRTQNGPDGTRRAALLADYFTQVAGGDFQLEDGHLLTCDTWTTTSSGMSTRALAISSMSCFIGSPLEITRPRMPRTGSNV